MSAPYTCCKLCPRRCGVNRLAGERGFCGETAELRLASASIHSGEEPPVTGKGGSGTVFVTGCNLGCAFCQNYQISREGMGRAVSTEEFAAVCLALQNNGAENINIVTGSHAIPALAAGIDAAKKAGLGIPVLWNSSAYESAAALQLLADHTTIDAWLPDLKTLDPALAARFFNAPDYPRIAEQAVLKMLELPSRFVIIRHLMLPGYPESTREVLRWFAEHARGKALLSLMTQYTPLGTKRGAPRSFVNSREYDQALEWLDEFGIEDGFCQELVTGSAWLPDFSRHNPFSSELSVPVWHWKGARLSL